MEQRRLLRDSVFNVSSSVVAALLGLIAVPLFVTRLPTGNYADWIVVLASSGSAHCVGSVRKGDGLCSAGGTHSSPNSAASPRAAHAPACICVPRPRGLRTTRTPIEEAISKVLSVLPPSVTMISFSPSKANRARRVYGSAISSFRAGTIMLTIFFDPGSCRGAAIRLAPQHHQVCKHVDIRQAGDRCDC